MRISGKAAKKLAKEHGVELPRKESSPLRGIHEGTMTLHLPWPPATNNLYVNVGKHRVPSSALRKYKKAVADHLDEYGVGHCTGRLSVEIHAYPPDKRIRDLDGMLKAMLDALTEARVWDDDSQIDRLSIVRCVTRAIGMMMVRVTGDTSR